MNRIDRYLWKVERYLHHHYTVDEAYRLYEPLAWYIYTCRASAGFIDRLLTIQPYVIGRILAKGGSTDEAIARVKARVWNA